MTVSHSRRKSLSSCCWSGRPPDPILAPMISSKVRMDSLGAGSPGVTAGAGGSGAAEEVTGGGGWPARLAAAAARAWA
eukprot:CAMPEP_0197421584 /NCGR_PEP_ID=MMETSP1170-20131217/9653_1 /TAXON_ID=54406 /ORGANISM="Sarcinochrysis sp, Strain CCMP770" /LENGTH=77 /DNA_ID=CAMNT_0042948835 /DNA_START=170 /DNA_END=403 /DNA_ORIENTATION=+